MKFIIIKSSKSVLNYLKNNFDGEIIIKNSLSDLEESDFPSIVFQNIESVNFDLQSLLDSEKSSALIELKENREGYDLMGDKIVKRVDSKMKKDSFFLIGVYNIKTTNDMNYLFSPEGLKGVIGARRKEELSVDQYKKCLFLDRDGVLNFDGHYPYLYEEMSFYDDICETLIEWKNQGGLICVVTNQSGIARGKYSEDDVLTLHKKMHFHFKKIGVEIDGWYYSPYHTHEDCLDKYRYDSYMRKPNGGMIFRAMEDFPITLKGSVMVGDKESDKLFAVPVKTYHIQRDYDLTNAVDEVLINYDQLKKKLAKL